MTNRPSLNFAWEKSARQLVGSSACKLQLTSLLLTSLLLTSGCVTRSLTIQTNPAGALVYFNDELKGPSPVTYDFMWYGWHRVMLRKDGFERVEDRKLLSAPFHLWIPFDLVMELLPTRIRDTRTWSYTLSPMQQLPTPVPPPLTGSRKAPQVSTTPEATQPVSDQMQSSPNAAAGGTSGENAPASTEGPSCPGCESKSVDATKESTNEAR